MLQKSIQRMIYYLYTLLEQGLLEDISDVIEEYTKNDLLFVYSS